MHQIRLLKGRYFGKKNGDGSIYCTYDPFGRRTSKTVSASPANAGGTTYYLYSDEGLIGEYDSTGAEIKTYGYKPNSTWSTDPLFMKQGTDYFFYHNDHLGTPQKMTNISGAIVWSATYDAFGKATVDGASTITNNLRFPGQYFDAETNLHYNWNRYYDSSTGRYVTQDPIEFDGEDINLYAYVSNNPVNYIDPFGETVSKDPSMTSAMPLPSVMKGLECMSKCLQRTITIGSGWRTKEQNDKLKGSAKNSYHLRGLAADVYKPPDEAKLRQAARECGFFVLSRVYKWGIHVDLRGGITPKSEPNECECQKIREGR